MKLGQMRRWPAVAVLSCLIVGSVTGTAIAANIVTGAVFRTDTLAPILTTLDEFSQTSSLPIADSAFSESAVDGLSDEMGFVDARAGFGSVGVRGRAANSYVVAPSVFSTHYRGMHSSGDASATFTDMLVTGPGSGNISTRLRLHLGGTLDVGTSGSTVPDAIFASSAATVFIYVNGTPVASGDRVKESTNGTGVGGYATGVFSGLGDFGVVTTNLFSVPLNTPFSVRLDMTHQLRSRVSKMVAGSAGGSSDYYSSLSFVIDQPVFDLPPGYTANSVSGGILNNSYLGVPEPGCLAFTAVAAGLMTMFRRRPSH